MQVGPAADGEIDAVRAPSLDGVQLTVEALVSTVRSDGFIGRVRFAIDAEATAREPGVVQLIDEKQSPQPCRGFVHIREDRRTRFGVCLDAPPHATQPGLAPGAEKRSAIEPEAGFVGLVLANALLVEKDATQFLPELRVGRDEVAPAL